MALFPKPVGLSDDGLTERWEKLRAIRDIVNKALEEARRRGEIGKSLEAKVVLRAGDESVMELLESHRGILPDVFIVSSVEIQRVDGSETAAEVLPALGEKCQRCWVVTTQPQAVEGGPLCPRCARATQ
jgi:isoleucyl-tRNA synthetase